MNNVEFKFLPGDILYSAEVDQDNEIIVSKGKVEYCYLNADSEKEYACKDWGNDIEESKTFNEKEILKEVQRLLKKI